MKVSSIYYLCFLNNKKYLKSSENKTLWLRKNQKFQFSVYNSKKLEYFEKLTVYK